VIVVSTTPQGATRLCPVCHHADPLRDAEATWPRDWVCPSCGHAVIVREGIVLTAPALADTVSGFDPGDFDVLARAELTHFWFVARRRLLVALAAAYAPDARRFVELGCGSGNVLDVLARARAWQRIVGTDLHPSGLKWARERVASSVELIQVDARHLPFGDAFDAVGAFDVIEHIAEDEQVIASVRSALVTGGVFLSTVPQHPSLWSLADTVSHHVRRYRRGELEAKLRAGGFDIVFSTSYAVSLLPLMAVSRLRARRTEPIDDVDARTITRTELDVHPTLNRVLTSILNAEVALTQRGIRWPVGGSRVVVARKR
jgi:SAM-dependent methyltransferase